MAWSVDNIYSFIKFLIRKNQSGGVSANDIFYAWNPEQAAFMQDMLGRFQRNSNSKEGINTGAIENQVIKTKLAPFTKPITISIVNGQAIKPTDFTYAWAIRETVSQQRVWPVNHDQIYAVLEDVIDPPSITLNNYYCTEYQNYYQVYPANTASIDLDYCSSPPDIVWGFTLDSNNRQVYNPNPASSVQPLWSQSAIIEITKRCLNNFGVSFKDADFAAYGKSTIVTGD